MPRRHARRNSAGSLPHQRMTDHRRWQEASTSRKRDPATSQGARGGSTEKASVCLPVIQLVLCQEEVAAWRNASTF